MKALKEIVVQTDFYFAKGKSDFYRGINKNGYDSAENPMGYLCWQNGWNEAKSEYKNTLEDSILAVWLS